MLHEPHHAGVVAGTGADAPNPSCGHGHGGERSTAGSTGPCPCSSDRDCARRRASWRRTDRGHGVWPTRSVGPIAFETAWRNSFDRSREAPAEGDVSENRERGPCRISRCGELSQTHCGSGPGAPGLSGLPSSKLMTSLRAAGRPRRGRLAAPSAHVRLPMESGVVPPAGCVGAPGGALLVVGRAVRRAIAVRESMDRREPLGRCVRPAASPSPPLRDAHRAGQPRAVRRWDEPPCPVQAHDSLAGPSAGTRASPSATTRGAGPREELGVEFDVLAEQVGGRHGAVGTAERTLCSRHERPNRRGVEMRSGSSAATGPAPRPVEHTAWAAHDSGESSSGGSAEPSWDRHRANPSSCSRRIASARSAPTRSWSTNRPGPSPLITSARGNWVRADGSCAGGQECRGQREPLTARRRRQVGGIARLERYLRRELLPRDRTVEERRCREELCALRGVEDGENSTLLEGRRSSPRTAWQPNRTVLSGPADASASNTAAGVAGSAIQWRPPSTRTPSRCAASERAAGSSGTSAGSSTANRSGAPLVAAEPRSAACTRRVADGASAQVATSTNRTALALTGVTPATTRSAQGT